MPGEVALPLPPDTRADVEWVSGEFSKLARVIEGTRVTQAQGVRVAGWSGLSANAYTDSSRAVGECAQHVADALSGASQALKGWHERLVHAIAVAVPALQERYSQADQEFRKSRFDLEQSIALAQASGEPLMSSVVKQQENAILARKTQIQAEIVADYKSEMEALDTSAQDAASAVKASTGMAVLHPLAAALLMNNGTLAPPGKWSDEDYREGRRGSEGAEGPIPQEGSEPGLGDPVPGADAPMPRPKPWEYPGDTETEGSGPHGQRDAGPGDHLTHELAGIAATVMSGSWPDASVNLKHYLANSGNPMDVNVDGMLNDLPRMNGEVSSAVERQAQYAIAAAQESGITEPVTYPFVTNWTEHYAGPNDSKNWYYATGGFQHATAGTVTVYPPSGPGGEWTCEYKYQTHMADRYNWDGTKSTEILGMTITDKELQELHRAGIAQEYDLHGESSVRTGP